MAQRENVSVQVDFMHLCDYAVTTEHGKPAIIGIFDRLGAPSFPCTHPSMALAIKFTGQPNAIVPVKIVIEGPDGGRMVDSPEGPVPIGAEAQAFLKIEFVGLQFKSPGRYLVSVISQGAVLASQTLRLLKVNAKAA